jgi:hypothetical protein
MSKYLDNTDDRLQIRSMHGNVKSCNDVSSVTVERVSFFYDDSRDDQAGLFTP